MWGFEQRLSERIATGSPRMQRDGGPALRPTRFYWSYSGLEGELVAKKPSEEAPINAARREFVASLS